MSNNTPIATFDCYRTLIDFDLNRLALPIVQERLDEVGIDHDTFLDNLRVMRFQAVAEGPYRRYQDLVRSTLESAMLLHGARYELIGTWRGRNGRFTTHYKVDAAYASGFCDSFDFSLELSGSCIHKITGQSGVFAGTEGVYTMFDVITNVTGDPVTGAFAAGSGANNFLYAGRIQTSIAATGQSAAFEDAPLTGARSSLVPEIAERKARSGRSC